MNEHEMKIYDGLIAEYELRAKYNADQRDYETYHMLVKARGILADHIENNGCKIYKDNCPGYKDGKCISIESCMYKE